MGLLEALCLVVKLVRPDATDIVGLATEPGLGIQRSEDVMYYDARSWCEEHRQRAEQLRRDLGLLTQCGPMFRSKEYQFPARVQPGLASRRTSEKRGQSLRNSECPCGSGKKWKRCCRRVGG